MAELNGNALIYRLLCNSTILCTRLCVNTWGQSENNKTNKQQQNLFPHWHLHITFPQMHHWVLQLQNNPVRSGKVPSKKWPYYFSALHPPVTLNKQNLSWSNSLCLYCSHFFYLFIYCSHTSAAINRHNQLKPPKLSPFLMSAMAVQFDFFIFFFVFTPYPKFYLNAFHQKYCLFWTFPFCREGVMNNLHCTVVLEVVNLRQDEDLAGNTGTFIKIGGCWFVLADSSYLYCIHRLFNAKSNERTVWSTFHCNYMIICDKWVWFIEFKSSP